MLDPTPIEYQGDARSIGRCAALECGVTIWQGDPTKTVNGKLVHTECCKICTTCGQWLDDESASDPSYGPAVLIAHHEADGQREWHCAVCAASYVLERMVNLADDLDSLDINELTRDQIDGIVKEARWNSPKR